MPRPPGGIFTANLMGFNDEVEIINGGFAGYGTYIEIVIMCKKEAHLLHIITNGAWGVVFGNGYY